MPEKELIYFFTYILTRVDAFILVNSGKFVEHEDILCLINNIR